MAEALHPDSQANEPHPIDAHVGRRLKLRRSLMGMSQERLAQLLGITFQQIQKYERGVNRIGSSRLYEIAGFLQVPVSWFFENSEDAPEAAAAPAPTAAAPVPVTGLAEGATPFAFDGPAASQPLELKPKPAPFAPAASALAPRVHPLGLNEGAVSADFARTVPPATERPRRYRLPASAPRPPGGMAPRDTPVKNRETLEMVRAFLSITDPQVRKRLFELTKALAEVKYKGG